MKIEFDRDQLSKTLHQIGSVIEKKSTMPILGNILIEATVDRLAVLATDLEIGIRSECPVKVLTEGRVCVPARSFLDIVKELPEKTGKLRKGENDWLVIESGKAQFRIVGMKAEEFPQMLSPTSFTFNKLKTHTLRSAIEKTSFAISTDEMRYNLNGAFFEIIKERGQTLLRVVATDGHRLALFGKTLGEGEALQLKKGVILPRKGIMELRRLLSEVTDETIEMAVNDTNAAVRAEGTLIYMRLVVGEFPDYNMVLPKATKRKMMVDRDIFTRSLRRVSLLSEGKTKCIRLNVGKEGLHLAANSPELGEAEENVRAELEGEPLQIGFNARYLLDAVTVFDSEKVIIEFDHEQSPGVLKMPNEPGVFNVIMPMRI